MCIGGAVLSVVWYWFTFPMRCSLVISTSVAHMSPVVVLQSWISLPDDFPSVRDVTTARLLDVSSRNEGAFFDVFVLMIFDGIRADYDDNHFDSTFQFRSVSILKGSSRFFLCFLFLLLASQTGVSHQRHQRENRSGILAPTWQALQSASSLSALRVENGSISPILCRFHVSVSVGSPNDWYYDRGARGIVVDGWYAAAVVAVLFTTATVSRRSKDQTAQNPGKVLVRYSSRVNER